MATITISPGNSFTATETVTSTKLNDLGSPTAALTAASIVTADIADAAVTAAKLATDALELAYPVGSVYINASVATNPATLLGFGTWVAFGAGRVPVGIDSSDTDFDTAEETGGAKTHTLTTSEMPAHTHTTTIGTASGGSAPGALENRLENRIPVGGVNYTSSSTGGGQAHNNLQPYIVVHMWTRTA